MSISQILAHRLADYDNPQSLGFRLRCRRIAPLMKLIEVTYREQGYVTIIDIGGTETYWNILPDKFLSFHKTIVTIVNLPGEAVPKDQEIFRVVLGDGCDLSQFADHSFDIAHSNSVIEHVGDWQRMTRFAVELQRISKRYYVQTPNYWFPIEPHFMTPFFHWLPKPFRHSLLMRFPLGSWSKAKGIGEAVSAVESARLLDKRMFNELFSNADIRAERFLWMTKSLIAVKE